MKGCLTALGILVGLLVLLVGFLWLSFHDIHVRYRLTVEVLDGDEIRTGSSVIDTSYGMLPDFLWSGGSASVVIVGYAPTVDLGEKGLLFLTFLDAERAEGLIRERNKQLFCAADDMWCLPFAAYDNPGTRMDISGYRKRKVLLSGLLRNSGPREVPFIMLPRLARFLGTDDRPALMQVSPFDLASWFGHGIKLKRVFLELTGDPVTLRPQIWPQWLKEKGEMYAGTLYSHVPN
jgi:hypothetical protein